LRKDVNVQRAHSFFATLFDFSFSEFVTARLLKVIYGAAIGLWGIAGLGLLLGALSQSGLAALGALVLVPVGFLIAVTLTRIWVELVIVAFRIADHAAETAEQAAAIALNTAEAGRVHGTAAVGQAD
jgi:hypothetical protein